MASDLSLLVNVVTLMCERQISEYAAINLLVESDATTNKKNPLGLETARSIIRRAKKDAPDIWPVTINGKKVAPWSDEVRRPTVGEEIKGLLTKKSDG